MALRTFDSPCGALTACADGEAVWYLGFGTDIDTARYAVPPSGDNGEDILDTLEIQLKEYFDSRRKEFDIPVKLYGTTFQRAVWAGLMGIPYGKTITYGELASIIGKPSASRAVGGANHNNPVSILVPCHRVIGSGKGSWHKRLTGYGGGLENKALLLELEKRNTQSE